MYFLTSNTFSPFIASYFTSDFLIDILILLLLSIFFLVHHPFSAKGSFSERKACLPGMVTHLPGSDPSASVAEDELVQSQCKSYWASMPLDLLRNIIQRIEENERSWPSRKDVVSCASVCRSWREITKELVKNPEVSGILTFPLSVTQPGFRNSFIQCFIKRDRATSTYHLYLSLTSTLAESGKLLLVARKFQQATVSDYIISWNADGACLGNEAVVGKLRSNFLGTKFSIYERCFQCSSVASFDQPCKRHDTSQNLLDVAHISYEPTSKARGPRGMLCTLHSMPECVDRRGAASVSSDIETNEKQSTGHGRHQDEYLILKNKSPRWHEQLQCWCLNFKGRVTLASAKNFQLVSNEENTHKDDENVLLQFGKTGKNTFTMDFRYPLSAFQAFAICLSSFDTKLRT